MRFGVGDPMGRCSSVWRVWAEGRAGDVYVACRQAIGALKVSLHASGDFREAYTLPYMAQAGIPRGERVRLQWSRLDPEDGWIYAYRIKVPESELQPVDKPRIPEETYWHRVPEPGRTTEFTVLIGPHDVEQGPYPGGHVGALFLMELRAHNSDRVALMVHETTGTPDSEAQLEKQRVRTVDFVRSQGRSGWRNQRTIVPAVDVYGVGTAVEIAIPDDA